MSARFFVRVVLVAALALLFGSSPAVYSTTAIVDLPLGTYDLGDDDGDGLPNFLDPDDNDDGVLDNEPIPTPEPTTPPAPAPDPVAEPEPVSPEVTEPSEPSRPEAAPNEETAIAPPPAPVVQVVALPNTGIGQGPTISVSPVLFVGLLLLGLATVASSRQPNRSM